MPFILYTHKYIIYFNYFSYLISIKVEALWKYPSFKLNHFLLNTIKD